jgi:uncharacterized protein involved in exopolysaccharide biosynthesis
MKNEDSGISIQSIQFIIRHPWLFLCPIVIVLSITLSYASLLPEKYECTAVLSLGAVLSVGGSGGPQIVQTKFMQRKDDLLSKLLIGKYLKNIIDEAWPETGGKRMFANYSIYAAKLRKAKGGLSTTYDRKDPSILYVSFIDTDPAVAYKIVTAVIKTLQLINKESIEQDMTVGTGFLKRQLDFYKEKLKAVDSEVGTIKAKFREMEPYLSREDRDLISETTRDPAFSASAGQIVIQKSLKYEEMLAELNMQLLEARRKTRSIKTRIDTKDFAPRLDVGQNVNDDTLIKEYSQHIASQQLLLSALIAKGYTQEHPDAKAILMAIEDLRLLRENRVAELTGAKFSAELSDNAKKIAEEALKRELADTYNLINILKDKISLIDKYQKVSEDKFKPDMRVSIVAAEIARFKELMSEKDISSKYYADIRRQLEEAEIKSRVDGSKLGFEIKVIEPPKQPVKPLPLKKVSILLMGILAAMGSGVGLAYVVDMLDKSIKASAELRKLLKIPVIASTGRMFTVEEMNFRKRRSVTIVVALAFFAVLARLIVGIFIKITGLGQ